MKLKKVLSYALAAVMIISSVNCYEVRAERVQTAEGSAMESRIADIKAEVNTKEGGDSTVLEALKSGKRTISGEKYDDYTTYKGISVKTSSYENADTLTENITDKKLDTRWGSDHSQTSQYVLIDLGNTYPLKNIAIFWEGASAAKYEIQVSQDGNNFESIKTIESNVGKRTDDITFSNEINVRAVKVYCTQKTLPQYGYSIYEIGLFGNASQSISNLKISDYYKYTGKYMIYFTGQDDATSYNAYIDDSTKPIKKKIKSGEYLSEKELSDINNGKHTLYVASLDENGNELARIGEKIDITDNVGTYTEIPQVYIYSGKSITNEYHTDNDVSVTVVDKEGGTYKDIIDSECNIKIRGNSTAAAAKKPWNIKLSSKQKVLGMDKGKKWCLLANAFDKSLMRNSLVYDFGLEHGVTYTSQSRFVDVYINGRYNGNYLMTEPVEAKSGRVEIDAYNGENNDILLELGTRKEAGVDYFTTGILRTTFDVNDPEKGDDLADAVIDTKIARVKAYLERFETALKSGSYEDVLTYMDEDTFVNFYIVNELFKNVDFNYSSTRFYIKNNRIYAGPLWDYDLSSGNCKSSYYTDYYVDGVSYKGYYCRSMNWYRELFKKNEFQKKVSERYKELQYAIQNIYKENSEMTVSVDYLLKNFGTSFERNYISRNNLGAGWSLGNEKGDGYSLAGEAGWTTWMQPIDFLRDWLKNRNIWLCEQWGIDMNSAYEESKPEVTPPTTQPPTTQQPTTQPPTTQPPTTQQPTTQQPTTQQPTTQQPTTQLPTTQLPTTQPPTTDATTSVIPEKSSDRINVGRTKILKASKKGTKKAKISLKKVKGATGYVVKISTSKIFRKKVTITKKIKSSKIVFKKLKNKKYYVKARAFRIVDGKKRYGEWSKVKKIKR